MKRHLPDFILVIGLIFLFFGDLLVGFDGMFFGFTTSSNKMCQLIGLILFGMGALFALSSIIYLFYLKKVKT